MWQMTQKMVMCLLTTKANRLSIGGLAVVISKAELGDKAGQMVGLLIFKIAGYFG